LQSNGSTSCILNSNSYAAPMGGPGVAITKQNSSPQTIEE
jgi:hypothetical protein